MNYLVEDDKLIYNNYTSPPAKGVKTYGNLELSETDSSMVLKGSWKTNATRLYRSITGSIFLKKNNNIKETSIMPKLENLGVATSLSFMPYNNYARDPAASDKSIDSRSTAKMRYPNVTTQNLLINDVDSNSAGIKEIKNVMKPVFTDTQQVVAAGQSALKLLPNQITEI